MNSSKSNIQNANYKFKSDAAFGNRHLNSKRCLRPAVLMLVSILAFVLLLSGCSGSKLASGFNEDALKAAAEDTILALNAGDYEKISNEMVREDLSSALSPAVLENAANTVVKSAGAYVEIEKMVTVGQKDKTTGEDYAIVVAITKYESKKIQYTLSFNAKMEIVGFYLK